MNVKASDEEREGKMEAKKGRVEERYGEERGRKEVEV